MARNRERERQKVEWWTATQACAWIYFRDNQAVGAVAAEEQPGGHQPIDMMLLGYVDGQRRQQSSAPFASSAFGDEQRAELAAAVTAGRDAKRAVSSIFNKWMKRAGKDLLAAVAAGRVPALPPVDYRLTDADQLGQHVYSGAELREEWPPRGVAVKRPAEPTRRSPGRPSGSTKYDWPTFQREALKQLEAQGGIIDGPASDQRKADLARRMLEWCQKKWRDNEPSWSMIRNQVDQAVLRFNGSAE